MREEYSVLPLLIELGRRGCLYTPVRISRTELAKSLGVSAWKLRRLLELAVEEGYLLTNRVGNSTYYKLSARGRRLLEAVYRDLRSLFEDKTVVLKGVVTKGLGEGAVYMSIPEYRARFAEILGYEPFAGTLNVKLHDEYVPARKALRDMQGYRIEGFTLNGRRYGGVTVYRAVIRGRDKSANCALLDLEVTRHGDDVVELIAPVRLRDELGLKDGDPVEIYVFV